MISPTKHILFVLVLIAHSGLGQDTPVHFVNAVNYLEKSVWRLTILAPGLLNELRVGSKTTLVTSAQLSGVLASPGISILSIGGRATPFNLNLYLNSYASVGGRYFYNIQRRYTKGKSIQYNSANYLMIRSNYTFPPFQIEYEPRVSIGVFEGLSVNILWGLQRTFQDNVYLNFATGIKIAPNGLGLAGNFIIGYTFPNKKGLHN